MKKIIVLLCAILLCGLSANAQTSMSFTDSLKMYEGTWKYENTQNAEIFIIKLAMYSSLKYGETCYDYLGTYSYRKNGKEVFNVLNTTFPAAQTSYLDITLKEASLFPIWLGCNKYANALNLYFRDHVYKKYEDGGYVQLLSTKAGDEKLLWYPQNGEGVRVYVTGEPEEPEGFSVPVNVVMTKVH